MQKRIIAMALCLAMLLGLLAGCKPQNVDITTAPATTAPGETVPQGGEGPEQEQPTEPSGGQTGEEETPDEQKPEEEKPDEPQTGGQPSAGLPSYLVRFFTNGGEAIESRYYLQGTKISQLPTPYRLSHRFEGWFYDAGLTKPAAGTDKVNGAVSLYAKYSALEAPEEAKLASFASSVEEQGSFTLTILCADENLTAAEILVLLSVKNLSDPEAKDFYTVTGEKGVFVLAGKEGFRPGSTFRVKLEDGRLSFRGQDTSIREYNFTTAKEAVMNVQLNDGLVYIPMEQLSDIVNNGQKVDTLSLPVYTMDGEGNITPAAMTSGQFTYKGEALQVDDTVVVYNGLRPDLRNENSTTEENGEVAYLKITAVNGQTYSYTSAKAEEILLRPDLLPVRVELDLDKSDSTVTLENKYLDYSDDLYANIRLDSETTVDVGDFLVFHEGMFSIRGTEPIGYGRVTVVTAGAETTVITYEVCDWQTVESSMDLRTTESISGEKMLEGVDVEELEQQIEEQARASGFADEMALYLVSMATATENFTELPDGMELSDIRVLLDDGTEMSAEQLRLMGEGITAKPSISRLKVWITDELKHFDRTGVRVSLELGVKISFYKKYDNKVEGSEAPDKQIVLEVVGIFEQEVSLDLDVSAHAVWNNWGPFYYIDDYRMVAAIDMYTYSGVNIELNVGTKEKTQNGEYTGIEKYDEFADKVIKAIKLGKAVWPDNTVDLTDQLADKYTEFLNNETDWVYLVDKKMFGFNIPIPAVFPILVLEMNCNFVISVDASVAMGLDYYTKSANRYVYTVDVLSLRVFSDVVPIQEEQSELTLYAFGRAGLRIGVKATFLIGLLDTEFISAGISAEAGAYVKVFGYLYYCRTNSVTQGVDRDFSGAMYLEVGGYLQINFESQAFVDLLTWSPTLYEDEWPIWTVGARQNVLNFATDQEDMPEVNLKSHIQSAWLSDDLFVMEFLDLKEGGLHTAIYSDEEHFTVTMSNDKFSYDAATNTVTVDPDEDDVQLDGTMTITWDLDPMVFSSDALQRTVSLHWDNLRDGYVIVPYTNGGSYVAIIDQAYGTAVKTPKDPVKVGYVFTGWYTDRECTQSYTFPQTMPNEDANIYAGWAPATDTGYAVEHYTQVLGSSTYELAERETFTGTTDSVVSPATRTYTGFITPARQELTILPDGSAAVHYFYDRIVSTVTFDPGVITGEKVSFLLQYGASVHAPRMAAEGYDFMGWDKEVSPIMGAENVTYTAQWKRSQVDYRVEFYVQQIDGRYTLQDKVSGRAVVGTELSEQQLLNTLLSNGKTAGVTYTVAGGVEFASVTVGAMDLTAQGRNAIVEADAVIKVNFRRLSHTATFEPGNGQTPVKVTLFYEAPLQAPVGLLRTGYAFAGWDKTVPAVMGTKDLTFCALWTANDYRVVFHANGGSGTMTDQGMVYDREAVLQKNSFTRAGYDFVGWSLSDDGAIVYADGETVKNLTAQKKTVDLYAVWNVHSYTIRYELGGGVNGANPTAYTVLDSFALAPAARTGYVFAGWLLDGRIVTNIQTGTTGDLVLTAQWTPGTDTAYTVEHWLEGLNGAEAQLAQTDRLTGTTGAAVTPAVAAFEGFTAPKAQRATVLADGSLVVKYFYSRNSYTLTFAYQDGKTPNSTVTAQYGAAVTLPGPARVGYGFGGWYRNEACTGERWTATTMGAESLTLYAKWIAGEYGYTVIHRTENLDGTWSVVETEHHTAKMDQKVIPAVRSFEGFTAPKTVTMTIGTGVNEVTYDYTRNSYRLTWDLGGGKATGSYTEGMILYGAPILAPELQKTGHTFAGWNGQVPQTMPAGAVTLKAVWNINSYTLTLYRTGTDYSVFTLCYGQELPEIGTPIRTGYSFTGWSGELPKTMPDRNLEFYAGWEVVVYTITYLNMEGATHSNPHTYTVETRGFQLSSPKKTGYTFRGWEDEEGKPAVAVSSVGDRVFTALWQNNRYMVVYNANNGTGEQLLANNKIYDVEFVAERNTFTKSGYHFVGWALTADGEAVYGDGAVLKNLTAEANGYVHLYAVWAPESYGIEYNLGSVTNDPRNPETYVMDSEITLYAPLNAPTGKHFVGWYLDAKLTKPAGEKLWVSVAGGLALYPKWEANQYVLNFYAFRKDTNLGDAQQVVTYGENDWLWTVNKLNTEGAGRFKNPGYTLTGWSFVEGTAADVSVDTTIMQVLTLLGDRLPTDHMSAVDLHAVWTPNHYGVTFVGGEGVSSAPSGFLFTIEDEEHFLDAYVPSLFPGYRFVGWYTDRACSGDPVTSIPEGTHEDVILYAKCELITYTITYHGNGGGLVGDYTTKYTIKDDIWIPEAKYDTYWEYQKFLGWYEDAELHHPFVNDLNTNPRNVDLYASWSLCTVYVGMSATPFTLSGRVIVDWSKEENCDFNTHTDRPNLQPGRAYNVDIANATEVIFIGSPGKTYTNFMMHLCNYGGGDALTLRFVDFNAVSNGTAINLYNVASMYDLEINVTGDCSLSTYAAGQNAIYVPGVPLTFTGDGTLIVKAGDGADATSSGGAGGTGGVGITADKIRDKLDGYLIVYGGNGGHGQKAADNNSYEGWSDGQTGYTGGAGGDGNYAIRLLNDSAQELKYSRHVYAFGGVGGNGGKGGRGGYSGVIGGTGGRGGSGGKGGNGAYGIMATSNAGGSAGGFGGQGGQGGAGGEGGVGDKMWAGTISKGATGSTGDGGTTQISECHYYQGNIHETAVTNFRNMHVYNNMGNGNVVHEKVGLSTRITVKGAASPGHGGFYQLTQSAAGELYIHVFIAKVPEGATLEYAANPYGDGGSMTWLGGNKGTGQYRPYAYVIQCGRTGTFSTVGFVYLNAPNANVPLEWYWNYGTVYKVG